MLFEKILLIATCVCAVIILFNRFITRKYNDGIIVDYARSFFPVLLIVFLLRSFIVEPFRIPSGSMLPTLEIGDFLLVNKFQYGLRLPIIYKKIMPIKNPERGDIMVFRYPANPKVNYIKRVIGLPGDKIEYKAKRLFVNKEEILFNDDGDYSFEDASGTQYTIDRFIANFDNEKTHSVLLNPRRKDFRQGQWQVPEGQYFVMGDNRDHSADSRVWGFVPEANIVGKAFFIWFHWDTVTERGLDFKRIGDPI